MTKPSALFPGSSSSSKLEIDQRAAGSRQSQVIAKLKPKIRVIHVDSPKIIQTDAANFRDLVQRLTGKPGDNRNWTPPIRKEEEDFLGLRDGKRMKNEDEEEEEEEDDDDEISRRSKSNKEIRLSGFFDHHHGGFSEVDGFMEQLSTMN